MVSRFSRISLATATAFCLLVPGADRGLGQLPAQGPDTSPAAARECTRLLQAHDVKSVDACKQYVAEADAGPPTEKMERIIANDEYGIALLAFGHQPQQGLEAFNREIAMLPESTVKPDSLQWAAAYWHRATAYQQLGRMDPAAQDLGAAEATLQKAAEASKGEPQEQQHFQSLRKQVVAQHAALLEHEGKHAEAQQLLATQ